jgi:hypothetical protein
VGKPGRPSGRPGKKRGRTCRKLKHTTGFKAQRKQQPDRKVKPRFQSIKTRSNGSRCTTRGGMATSFAGPVFERVQADGENARAAGRVTPCAPLRDRYAAARRGLTRPTMAFPARTERIALARNRGLSAGTRRLLPGKQFHGSSPGKTCRYGVVGIGGWRP